MEGSVVLGLEEADVLSQRFAHSEELVAAAAAAGRRAVATSEQRPNRAALAEGSAAAAASAAATAMLLLEQCSFPAIDGGRARERGPLRQSNPGGQVHRRGAKGHWDDYSRNVALHMLASWCTALIPGTIIGDGFYDL
ncbi:unnamed protein product [Gongylonema pulchrum]|uniref:Uncharacterized protein n=1 Tax=Gongylonema pulchrum TaxID=637853 RepID=A0A183DRF8_9BILA|nr:unnamed protein product [Gongylonema pulchrum]